MPEKSEPGNDWTNRQQDRMKQAQERKQPKGMGSEKGPSDSKRQERLRRRRQALIQKERNRRRVLASRGIRLRPD